MNLYQKTSGIWAVDLRSLGRGRVSLGTRDKVVARKRALMAVNGQDFEADTNAPGRPASVATPVGTSVAQLFRRCMNDPDVWMLTRSQATLKSNDRILCATEVALEDGTLVPFGELDITQVTSAVLRSLSKALQAKKYAQASVRRKMDMVGRAFREAADWDLIPTKPKMPSITVPDNSRKRVLSPKEQQAVFRAIERRAKAQPHGDWVRFGALIQFFLDTGVRKAEAENVRTDWIKEISLEGGRVVTRMTIPGWIAKNGKPRTIPLTAAVVAMLPDLTRMAVEAPAGRPKGLLLFPYSGGFIWYRWQGIVADVKEADGLDLSDCVIHSFRHTCLTRLSERGLPIEKVADWAGHADIKITMKHYRHVGAEGLDAGADLLA